MLDALSAAGLQAYGGVNAPYIWLRTPEGTSSWQFFDQLLHGPHIVGTPGVGFGPSGEGYFRLTAFGDRSDCERGDGAAHQVAALENKRDSKRK